MHAGRRVTVYSDLEPAWGDEAAAREMFAHTARTVAERHAEVVAASTRVLLPTWNDVWRVPEAAPLSAAAFVAAWSSRASAPAHPPIRRG